VNFHPLAYIQKRHNLANITEILMLHFSSLFRLFLP